MHLLIYLLTFPLTIYTHVHGHILAFSLGSLHVFAQASLLVFLTTVINNHMHESDSKGSV
jgi:hypothetical protein